MVVVDCVIVIIKGFIFDFLVIFIKLILDKLEKNEERVFVFFILRFFNVSGCVFFISEEVKVSILGLFEIYCFFLCLSVC